MKKIITTLLILVTLTISYCVTVLAIPNSPPAVGPHSTGWNYIAYGTPAIHDTNFDKFGELMDESRLYHHSERDKNWCYVYGKLSNGEYVWGYIGHASMAYSVDDSNTPVPPGATSTPDEPTPAPEPASISDEPAPIPDEPAPVPASIPDEPTPVPASALEKPTSAPVLIPSVIIPTLTTTTTTFSNYITCWHYVTPYYVNYYPYYRCSCIR